MYQVFNCSHCIEIYVPNQDIANEIIRISNLYHVGAQIIGRVEERKT